MSIRVRFLSWLLRRANAHVVAHRQFYELKDRLLRKYGTRDGDDIQHIQHECWGDEGIGCRGESCWKCGGTGIFRTHRVRLERWRMGARVFHRPTQEWVPPEIPATITGRIEHKHTSHHAASEARLWLYLLCDRRMFWRALLASRTHQLRAWPMLRLQAIVFEAWQIGYRFRVRTCPTCQRRFIRPTKHNGWVLVECRRCENVREIDRRIDPDCDLPF